MLLKYKNEILFQVYRVINFMYKAFLVVFILKVLPYDVSFFIKFLDIKDIKAENLILSNLIILCVIIFRFSFKFFLEKRGILIPKK